MEKKPDAVYKTGKATVRIHGTADREKVKAATEKYLKRFIPRDKEEQHEKRV